jgi:hypothetical protein
MCLSLGLEAVGTSLSFCPIVESDLILFGTTYANNTANDGLPLPWPALSIGIARSKSFGHRREQFPQSLGHSATQYYFLSLRGPAFTNGCMQERIIFINLMYGTRCYLLCIN